MAPSIDVAQIKKAAHNNIPITIKTFKLPHETEEYIEQILDLYLKEIGYKELINPISYCLKELAVNAKKANTKRVYFQEKQLKIDDKNDYEIGMQGFKTETLKNIEYYLDKQKDSGLYIKVVLKTVEKTLEISVHNNVHITKREQMRVYDRIARSRAFNSMEEAFASVLDNSEGAGLGIVILILMLKKIGLSEDNFEVDIDGEETVARISIPFNELKLEQLAMLTKQIVREIDSLPQFPENLIHLQKLIMDPESDLQVIARQVGTDPALTADLLKQVNSALYMLPKKVDNITEAVKLVGMRGLRNLLYKYGSQKILQQKYSEMRELWKHCYKVAYYAYNISRSLRKKKDTWDDAFVGGILHDLGKIVVNSMHPELLERIKRFCTSKNVPSGILEDLSVGLNHAEIGAQIAEKWNFPEILVNIIRHHHNPMAAPAEYREISSMIYLANILTHFERAEVLYDQIDPEVLKLCGIESENQVRTLLARFAQNLEDDNMQYSASSL